MKKLFLIANILVLVFLASSCETLSGTLVGAGTGLQKDTANAGKVLCKTGETISGAFSDGNDGKPKGIITKADDWVKEHLW